MAIAIMTNRLKTGKNMHQPYASMFVHAAGKKSGSSQAFFYSIISKNHRSCNTKYKSNAIKVYEKISPAHHKPRCTSIKPIRQNMSVMPPQAKKMQ